MRDMLAPQDDRTGAGAIAIAVFGGWSPEGPILAFAEAPADEWHGGASTLVNLTEDDIGCEVAVAFPHGARAAAIILGKLTRSSSRPATAPPDPPPILTVDSTPTPLEITAEREITLRCGKASITLTREGKIILRGTYISSRSSGVNRIKGGSVQLN